MFILKANNPSVIMDEETFFCCLAVFAFLRFITWKPSLVYLEVSFSWKSSSVYITIERYLWSSSAFATICLSCKIPTYVTSVTICKKKKKRFTYLHRIKKKGSSVPCLHLRCALSVLDVPYLIMCVYVSLSSSVDWVSRGLRLCDHVWSRINHQPHIVFEASVAKELPSVEETDSSLTVLTPVSLY